MEASNMQKMREALDAVLCNWTEDGFGFIKESTIEAVKQALSAPPRNCDIGTVDEQIARHYRYCSCRIGDGDNPHGCGHISCSECTLRWAQMEYEKEGK